MSKPDRPLTPESALEQITAGKTAHEILGVAKDASEADINKAFKKLSLFVHPDSRYNQGDERKKAAATEAFQKLNAAHKKLTNPQQEVEVDSEDEIEAVRKEVVERKQMIESRYGISPDRLMDNIERRVRSRSPIFGSLHSEQRMVNLLFNELSEGKDPTQLMAEMDRLPPRLLARYAIDKGPELNLATISEIAEQEVAHLRSDYLASWQYKQQLAGKPHDQKALDTKAEEIRNLRHPHQFTALQAGVSIANAEMISEEQFNQLMRWKTQEFTTKRHIVTGEEMNAQCEKFFARERAARATEHKPVEVDLTSDPTLPKEPKVYVAAETEKPSPSPKPTSCFNFVDMVRGIATNLKTAATRVGEAMSKAGSVMSDGVREAMKGLKGVFSSSKNPTEVEETQVKDWTAHVGGKGGGRSGGGRE